MAGFICKLVVFVLASICQISLWAADKPQDNQVAWMLGCQGCHGASGVALGNEVPALENTVARFLSVQGGREYLIRVPGVAMSHLDNAAIAQLTNWMLRTMDPDHIPLNFEEYSALEVGELRQNPLGFEAATVRAQLVAKNAKYFD